MSGKTSIFSKWAIKKSTRQIPVISGKTKITKANFLMNSVREQEQKMLV
jgi:hypothetical protein